MTKANGNVCYVRPASNGLRLAIGHYEESATRFDLIGKQRAAAHLLTV